MAKYQITFWRNIPSLVTAQEGRRNRVRVELPVRFQEAIDEGAMRAGLAGTDAYLDQWRKSDWQEREGEPKEVADSVAAELESEYSEAKVRELISDRR